jgi:hypothetical protein
VEHPRVYGCSFLLFLFMGIGFPLPEFGLSVPSIHESEVWMGEVPDVEEEVDFRGRQEWRVVGRVGLGIYEKQRESSEFKRERCASIGNILSPWSGRSCGDFVELVRRNNLRG